MIDAVISELDDPNSELNRISQKRTQLNTNELYNLILFYDREIEKHTLDDTAMQLYWIISFLNSLFILDESYLITAIKSSIDLYVYALRDCSKDEKIGYLIDLKKIIDHEVFINITTHAMATIERAEVIEKYKRETGDTNCKHILDYCSEFQKEERIKRDFLIYDSLKQDSDLCDYFEAKFHKTPEEVFCHLGELDCEKYL